MPVVRVGAAGELTEPSYTLPLAAAVTVIGIGVIVRLPGVKVRYAVL
jgi:hypothetical protein